MDRRILGFSQSDFPMQSPDTLIQTLMDSGILSEEDLTRITQCGSNPGTNKASSTPLESGAEVLEQLKQIGRLSDFQIETIEHDGPDALLLSDYVLLDRIGSGGMGEVYRAVHRVMRREVAIKRLKTGSVDVPGLADRFMREVRTAAKLSHPNIVAAYDAGEDEAGCYLVMEYVPGRDLAEIIREEGPLATGRAVKLLIQAACALDYAHRAGIIHRDIKPANFLIDQSGTLKLLDLGLARVEQKIAEAEQSANLTLTHANQIMGTLAYMAPEQAEDPHNASVTSDLYALGCTFCHMVTGQPPFISASTTQALIAHREAPPPDLSALLPEALNNIFLSLLAKDPSARPQSASDVIQQLQALDSTIASSGPSDVSRRIEPRDHQTTSPGTKRSSGPSGAPIATPKQRSKKPLIIAGSLVVIALVTTAIVVLVPHGNTDQTVTPADDVARASDSPENSKQNEAQTHVELITPSNAAALQQSQASAADQTVEVTNSVGMKMRYIPTGRCQLGSTDEQVKWAFGQVKAIGLYDRYGPYIDSERPTRIKTIDKPFYLASTETTVGQFRQFVEATRYKTLPETDGIGGISYETNVAAPDINWDNPGMNQDDTHPVINITQIDAIAFCKWLSEKEGVTYRLPTDDEWEYACRAGNIGRWCFGDDPFLFDQYGWCYYDSPNGSQPVAKLKPNAFGMYDMHGNAREWVLFNDGTNEGKFGEGIVRGGSFTKSPVLLRSASRVGFKVRSPYPYHSFRVLREIDVIERE